MNSPARKTTILLLGSMPADVDQLEITLEFNEIDEQLQKTKFRDHFDIQQKWEVRAEQLPELIMRYEPEILHFSGHGDGDGQLLFEGSDGLSYPANPQTIAAVFGVLRNTVRCVVLNACHSAEQAEQIAQHVDVVVGMSRAVGDPDAIAFALGFYGALGYGKDVAAAFDLAKLRIDLLGRSESDVPRLYARPGINPARVFLHDPHTESHARPTALALTEPTSSSPPPPSSSQATGLSSVEKRLLEDWLEMKAGYVLNFTNRSFAEFIVDTTGLEIYDDCYERGSGSKAHRLRALWDTTPSNVTGKLLAAFVEYCDAGLAEGKEEAKHRERARVIARRLLGVAD